MSAPAAVFGTKAVIGFINSVGTGAVGLGVAPTLSADQEKLGFDQLLADVRAICNRPDANARQMNQRLFSFKRETQSGSTEYVLLEFDETEHTVRVSVTNAAGMTVIRQQAMSPSAIMNSFLSSRGTCKTPSALLRSAR
ncbi:MAG: hypothetical protein V2J10_05275 [Wenzhouxiangella sp.]|jgi:hypothetical protein|nr:hypothetical protein [Wenzhouxiangella sp.]